MRADELITLATYKTLSPHTKGYVVYMQGELANSELKGQTNPYKIGTQEYKDWNAGQLAAVIECQDIDG